MNTNHHVLPRTLELHGLAPAPEERWQKLRAFAGPSPVEWEAMRATVEPLFRRGHELVAGTYDYLLHTRETAAILGWETGADPEHLSERRRFFTIWLARVIGMDLSDSFACYLYHAGDIHAGHGPRRIHVPEQYVTGSIGLVQSAFASYLAEAGTPAATLAPALAGWNKYLLMQLDLMLAGYAAGRALDGGDMAVPVTLYGRLRPLAGCTELTAHVRAGEPLGVLLSKVFAVLPALRAEALELRWHDATPPGAVWMEVEPVYRVKRGWRILHNGRDAAFTAGLPAVLTSGDTVAIFPPGR